MANCKYFFAVFGMTSGACYWDVKIKNFSFYLHDCLFQNKFVGFGILFTNPDEI